MTDHSKQFVSITPLVHASRVLLPMSALQKENRKVVHFTVVWKSWAVDDKNVAHFFLPEVDGVRVHVAVQASEGASILDLHDGQLMVVSLSREDVHTGFANAFGRAVRACSADTALLQSSRTLRKTQQAANAWFNAALCRPLSERDSELFRDPLLALVTDQAERPDWGRLAKRCRDACSNGTCSADVAARCGLAAFDLERRGAANAQAEQDLEDARCAVMRACTRAKAAKREALRATLAARLASEQETAARKVLDGLEEKETDARLQLVAARKFATRAASEMNFSEGLVVDAEQLCVCR